MNELPITPKQMAELMKIAQTPQGKALLKMLEQRHGSLLKEAIRANDFQTARTILQEFLKDPEARDLLHQLGKL